MKKKVLTWVNILLGALSLGLAGCHTHKTVVKEGGPRPMLKYGVPTEVVAMYGVVVDADTLAAPVDTQTAPADTVAEPEKAPFDRRQVVVKYGVPNPPVDR